MHAFEIFPKFRRSAAVSLSLQRQLPVTVTFHEVRPMWILTVQGHEDVLRQYV